MEMRLTQEEVAKILSVSTDTITNWENIRTKPSDNRMVRIMKFLGYIPAKNVDMPSGE